MHLLYSFRFVSCCYRAMHYSAKRGIEIACPTSVCLSVCLSVCNVDGSGPYRLEILETKRTTKIGQSLRSSKPEDHPPTPRGTWENLGETRGGVGKSGVLEHKSSNISETRKDRGKVTPYYGGPIGTHQRSFERHQRRPHTASSSKRLGVRNPHPKIQSLLSQ